MGMTNYQTETMRPTNGTMPGTRNHRQKEPAKNDINEYLTTPEHQQLFAKFTPRSWTLCTTVAQVLEGYNGQWRLRNCGILCFIKDHIKKSFFLRLYDLNDPNPGASWNLELYLEIAIEMPTKSLLTFDGEGCRIGLNFSYESDCERMFTMINEKVCRRNNNQKSKSALRSDGAHSNNNNNSNHHHHTSNHHHTPNAAVGKMDKMLGQQQKQKYSAFDKLTKLSGLSNLVGDSKDLKGQQMQMEHRYQQKTGKKKGKLTVADISTPSEFRVTGGYNMERNKMNQKSRAEAAHMSEAEKQKWMIEVESDPLLKEFLLSNAHQLKIETTKDRDLAVTFYNKNKHALQERKNRSVRRPAQP